MLLNIILTLCTMAITIVAVESLSLLQLSIYVTTLLILLISYWKVKFNEQRILFRILLMADLLCFFIGVPAVI